jgi:hypothetical protein
LYTGGPIGTGVGMGQVGEKQFVFGTNTLQIVNLWILHSIHFPNYLTGGSDVRGKVGLN